jgi:hypothetical protein
VNPPQRERPDGRRVTGGRYRQFQAITAPAVIGYHRQPRTGLLGIVGKRVAEAVDERVGSPGQQVGQVVGAPRTQSRRAVSERGIGKRQIGGHAAPFCRSAVVH